MTLTGKLKSVFRRIPVFYLFLLAISPFLISLLIHVITLYYASHIQWSFGKQNTYEQDLPVNIISNGRKDEGLRFQGTDQLDSFKADENKSYPVPEIEYRPVIPETEIRQQTQDLRQKTEYKKEETLVFIIFDL